MDTKSRVSFASRLIRANFLSAHDTVGEVMQTYRADLLVCVSVCFHRSRLILQSDSYH